MTGVAQIEVTRLTLDVPAVSVAFTRALRDAGLPVSAEQATRFSRALTIARPITRRRLYFTARSVLACDQTQYAAFDAVFAVAFGGRGSGSDRRRRQRSWDRHRRRRRTRRPRRTGTSPASGILSVR